MSQEPMQDGSTAATDDDKVEGIIAQMRGDVSQGNVSDVDDALRQRLLDSGLDLSDAELARVLAAITAE